MATYVLVVEPQGLARQREALERARDTRRAAREKLRAAELVVPAEPAHDNTYEA